jgi:hypothetical protein
MNRDYKGLMLRNDEKEKSPRCKIGAYRGTFVATPLNPCYRIVV